MQWWSRSYWLTGRWVHHKPCIGGESNSRSYSKDPGVLCLGDEVEPMLPIEQFAEKTGEV